jgi:hypothetical protein
MLEFIWTDLMSDGYSIYFMAIIALLGAFLIRDIIKYGWIIEGGDDE